MNTRNFVRNAMKQKLLLKQILVVEVCEAV